MSATPTEIAAAKKQEEKKKQLVVKLGFIAACHGDKANKEKLILEMLQELANLHGELDEVDIGMMTRSLQAMRITGN